MKTIYMAGPLFTAAERDFNRELYFSLCRTFPNRASIYLPQDEADKYLPDLSRVYLKCIEAIKESHIVLANLDGSDADSGTSFECGYARAFNKVIIGYRSDFRGHEADGVNLMLRYGCDRYFSISDKKALFATVTQTLIDFGI